MLNSFILFGLIFSLLVGCQGASNTADNTGATLSTPSFYVVQASANSLLKASQTMGIPLSQVKIINAELLQNRAELRVGDVLFSSDEARKAFNAQAFKIMIKTDNVDASRISMRPSIVNEYLVSAYGDYDYDYSIDCNDDGTLEAVHQTTFYRCTYASAGEYRIAIRGTYPQFNSDGPVGGYYRKPELPDFPHYLKRNARKLLSIEQWGDIEWRSFNEALISTWQLQLNALDSPNLSAVTNMSLMFVSSSANPAIEHWDVSNVQDMSYMFASNSHFNQPLNDWDVSKVTNMEGMFNGAEAFNQPINDWDISQVTNMLSMFSFTPKFNQTLNNWNVSHVSNMALMFKHSKNFNQPLNNWDVSSVTDMNGMFLYATAFNQSLNRWDISNALNMREMLAGTAMSTEHYDALLKAWSLIAPIDSPRNVSISAKYSIDAESARNLLVNTYGWTISDEGLSE